MRALTIHITTVAAQLIGAVVDHVAAASRASNCENEERRRKKKQGGEKERTEGTVTNFAVEVRRDRNTKERNISLELLSLLTHRIVLLCKVLSCC